MPLSVADEREGNVGTVLARGREETPPATLQEVIEELEREEEPHGD